jgi:2-polyprenyl-3-methyl-5-hydroxy-6-metoxy-1,4-benzoquinol methylase
MRLARCLESHCEKTIVGDPVNTATERAKWLQQNANLRMDANDPVFPEGRRLFHKARYEFARQYCSGRRVLDGACGTGYGSSIIGEIAREVIGCDCSSEAIEYARSTYGRPHITFVRSFVESTPFPDSSFHVVVSFETVEHTLCPESHMMEIARLLEPTSGLAVISVPNGWGLTEHHFLDFNMGLLRTVIDPYFRGVTYYYQNPDSHPRRPGIGPLESDTPDEAQCIIAVCAHPRKENVVADRHGFAMDEIYRLAFQRHREYMSLAYRHNTSLARRVLNKLRALASSGARPIAE